MKVGVRWPGMASSGKRPRLSRGGIPAANILQAIQLPLCFGPRWSSESDQPFPKRPHFHIISILKNVANAYTFCSSCDVRELWLGPHLGQDPTSHLKCSLSPKKENAKGRFFFPPVDLTQYISLPQQGCRILLLFGFYFSLFYRYTQQCV